VIIKFCFHKKAPLSATVPKNYNTKNVKSRIKFLTLWCAPIALRYFPMYEMSRVAAKIYQK
ncbi:MAG: hypothetical protein ACMG55_18845, partial [Microcoleus sp.]